MEYPNPFMASRTVPDPVPCDSLDQAAFGSQQPQRMFGAVGTPEPPSHLSQQ